VFVVGDLQYLMCSVDISHSLARFSMDISTVLLVTVTGQKADQNYFTGNMTFIFSLMAIEVTCISSLTSEPYSK
jgi:hypothetical protein